MSDVYQLLRKRFKQEEYVLMQEVSDAAGLNRSRSIDFLAFNLWPSRGLAIHGIELKSFRGDWLKELKTPQKQENHIKQCDYFWLLTKDEKIAQLSEIPATWGWMAIRGEKIITMKEAPKLAPENLSKGFIAAMLKRSSNKDGWVMKNSIQDQINLEVEQMKRVYDNEKDYAKKHYEELKIEVANFEQSSGIKINRWDSDCNVKTGKAVRFVIDGGIEKQKEDLQKLLTKAESIYNNLKGIL